MTAPRQDGGGDLRKAALWYANHGWSVLPLHSVQSGRCTCGESDCNSSGKHPRTRKGLKDASINPKQIEAWWTRWPDANVGVRTGTKSGIIVVDVDPRNGGDESLAALVHEHGELPPTVQAHTGGGGEHHVFAAPETVLKTTKSSVAIGIDVKADGGYIVVAPSIHISGGCYRWREGHGPHELSPAAMPDWLLEMMRRSGQRPSTQPATQASGDAIADLITAANRYASTVPSASEGARNSAAFGLAGHLAAFQAEAGGRLTEGQVLDLVRLWNHRNAPPLGESELEQVVHSALHNGTARRAHVVRAAANGRPAKRNPGAGSAPTSRDDWPEPQPLPDELPPVQRFDFDLLPSSFRAWIEDVAERIQCPADFPAIAAMIALAAVVGRKVGIRPKRHDDWLVVPNLWGAAIGPPSVMKTPAIQEPLNPLKRMEIEAKKQFERELKQNNAQQLVAEERRKKAKSDIKAALADSEDAALEIARHAVSQEAPGPVRKRFIVNDSSVEKLGELLNENPNGFLCFRDELIGLLKSLEKEGQEGARSFYLEAWTGTGRYTYDRIGRGTIDIEAAIVSILGSIQPGPLRAYLHAAVANADGADGLMQRFQLAVYPDVPKEWRNVDRWPDTPARSNAYETIQRLSTAKPYEFGAQTDEFDPDGIPFLRFDTAAQEVFDGWRLQLETRLRNGGEHAAIEAHLAKYRSLIPSLALLIHLADGEIGNVGVEALRRAIAWGEYLESHARRIYAIAIAPDTAEAIALAGKVMSGALPDEFALRDVYRPMWIGLTTIEAAKRAVEMLIDLDWLVEVVEKTPGRDRTRYLVNPKLKRKRQS